MGLIFKKAPPCIKDYETTMVESGGNFLRDYSCEIVYREILKRRSTFLSFLAILIFFFFLLKKIYEANNFTRFRLAVFKRARLCFDRARSF